MFKDSLCRPERAFTRTTPLKGFHGAAHGDQDIDVALERMRARWSRRLRKTASTLAGGRRRFGNTRGVDAQLQQRTLQARRRSLVRTSGDCCDSGTYSNGRAAVRAKWPTSARARRKRQRKVGVDVRVLTRVPIALRHGRSASGTEGRVSDRLCAPHERIRSSVNGKRYRGDMVITRGLRPLVINVVSMDSFSRRLHSRSERERPGFAARASAGGAARTYSYTRLPGRAFDCMRRFGSVYG